MVVGKAPSHIVLLHEMADQENTRSKMNVWQRKNVFQPLMIFLNSRPIGTIIYPPDRQQPAGLALFNLWHGPISSVLGGCQEADI